MGHEPEMIAGRIPPLRGRRTLLVAPPGTRHIEFMACLVEQEITGSRDVMVFGEDATRMLPKGLLDSDRATVLNLGEQRQPADWKRLVDAYLERNPSLLCVYDAWQIPEDERERMHKGGDGIQIWETISFADFPATLFDSWCFLGMRSERDARKIEEVLGEPALRAITALTRLPSQGFVACVSVTRGQFENFDIETCRVPIPPRIHQWREMAKKPAESFPF